MHDNAFSSFRCAQCSKPVEYIGKEWGWKYNSRRFCSYSCMRERERADAARAAQSKAIHNKPNRENKHASGKRLDAKGRAVYVYTWRGETHTASEWAEITGIHEHALRTRMTVWDDLEKILTTPVLQRGDKKK